MALGAFLPSTEWVLFREETDATLWTGPASLSEEARSTDEFWAEEVDVEALEGDPDSFPEAKESTEFLLIDFSTAESKEDVEEETEDVCWVGVSWVDVQDAEGRRWGEEALSVGGFWPFPFCGSEQEEAAGGEDCFDEGELGSAAGEDGGEVWDNPFFSEECEDRDSWLPIGVVLELLLNVSPRRRNGNKPFK